MVFTRDDSAAPNFYKGSSFSRGEEEYLMDRWEENPVLWDIHHPEFKNYVLKESAREDIAHKMGKSAGDIKMKMKYLNDQYTRARRKILTNPELVNLSRRDEHLLRRLSFLQESKASSCPGFVTEIKDSQDTEGEGSSVVISSVTSGDPLLHLDDHDNNNSEETDDSAPVSESEDFINNSDPDWSTRHSIIENQAAEESDHDIKDVIINLHHVTPTVATASSTSTSSIPSPSPVLLTPVGANILRTGSPHSLLIPSNIKSNNSPKNNNIINNFNDSDIPQSALPPPPVFGGEPRVKKRKVCRASAADNSVTNERKSEEYFFGQFVIEALKTMSPDAKSWCQMEISKIIYQARSDNWKNPSTNVTSDHNS